MAHTTITLSEQEAREYVQALTDTMAALSTGELQSPRALLYFKLRDLRDILERGLIIEADFTPLKDPWQRPMVPPTVPSSGTER